MKRTIISVSLPIDMLEALRRKATQERRSVSQQLEVMIERKLKRQPQQRQAEAAQPEAAQ